MNPGQYISINHAHNAGHATPEATLETALWAMVNGDYEQALACHTPERRAAELGGLGDRENFCKASQLASNAVRGFHILAKKNLGDGRVEVKIKNDYDLEKWGPLTASLFPGKTIKIPPDIQVTPLIQLGTEWKLSLNDPTVEYNYSEKWDANGEVQVFTP